MPVLFWCAQDLRYDHNDQKRFLIHEIHECPFHGTYLQSQLVIPLDDLLEY